MNTRSSKAALIFASALGAASFLPLAAALAGTPNAATNATVATTSHGIYDGADQYRDAMGNVLPGWDVVVYGPNA
jgi:hypothetical protein